MTQGHLTPGHYVNDVHDKHSVERSEVISNNNPSTKDYVTLYHNHIWRYNGPLLWTFICRFLRASAMLKHVIDIGWTSVCLSVRHTLQLVLYQNG